MLRESVARFARERVMPKTRAMDEAQQMDLDLVKEIFEQGFMGVEIEDQYGGSGLSFISSCLVVQELARVDPAVAVMVDVQNTLVNTIMRNFGNAEQKAEWLPRLATDTVGAFCLSEPGSGSDAFAMKTIAKEEPGGDFVLNGTKLWITNAKKAGMFLVMANASPEKGYKGITTFLVPAGTPGLTVGKKEDKLGMRASSTCEVLLENCRVPKEAIVGKFGEGYKIAIGMLNEGRIGIGAQLVGLAEGCFESTMPYLHERKQFGQSVADFQGMRFQYAQVATEIHAARLMVYEAARLRENKLPFVHEAAMAKLYSSQVACNTTRKCIEWLGGVGFTKDFMAEKFYRDCIVGTIYEGTSNINLETIAKGIQQRYKS